MSPPTCVIRGLALPAAPMPIAILQRYNVVVRVKAEPALHIFVCRDAVHELDPDMPTPSACSQ